MTGPEHYRAAESLLDSPVRDPVTHHALMAAAQVHATLALAAGVGLLIATEAEPPAADCTAWRAAIGAQLAEK